MIWLAVGDELVVLDAFICLVHFLFKERDASILVVTLEVYLPELHC